MENNQRIRKIPQLDYRKIDRNSNTRKSTRFLSFTCKGISLLRRIALPKQ